jgi:hypothetical protein
MSSSVTLPKKVWGTKGFEFWTFLSLLLHASRPARVLELGSGRSTLTLAEYARFAKARFISLETSIEWYHRTFLELHFTGLETNCLKHIELDSNTGWYVLDRFHAAIRPVLPVDCVLVDAPNDANGNSTGMRDGPGAISTLKAVCDAAELILIDDVHRKHVFSTIAPTLSTIGDYDLYYFEYSVLSSHQNSLCICARKRSKACLAIRSIEAALGLSLKREWTAAQCPEP